MTNPFFSGRWDGQLRQFFGTAGNAGFEREFLQTIETGFEAELSLENETGRIEVRGHDLPEVRIRLRAHLYLQSDDAADDELEALKAGVQVDGNRVSIRTPYLRRPGLLASWGPGVDYELIVPRQTRLTIKAANGSVDTEGLQGPVNVACQNGAIRVEGAGEAELDSTNGAITLSDVAGHARAEAKNGSITGESVGGSFSARTRNGLVRYRGNIGAGITLESDTGGLRVALPETSRFELDAETDVGSVRSEFEVRDVRPEAADASPQVRLRTKTGGIVIEKL
jgi:hypothetical protein